MLIPVAVSTFLKRLGLTPTWEIHFCCSENLTATKQSLTDAGPVGTRERSAGRRVAPLTGVFSFPGAPATTAGHLSTSTVLAEASLTAHFWAVLNLAGLGQEDGDSASRFRCRATGADPGSSPTRPWNVEIRLFSCLDLHFGDRTTSSPPSPSSSSLMKLWSREPMRARSSGVSAIRQLFSYSCNRRRY